MKNKIEMIKGTTYIIPLTVTDENNQNYILKENEKIIFGVKKNPQNTEYDIKKILTANNYDGSKYFILIDPEDTDSLPYGSYSYDIGVQLQNGEYYMIIPVSEFWIEKCITSKEA